MEEILDILGKKLKGEASPEELTALQEWLDSDPENQILANELSATWDKSEDGGFDWEPNVDTAWNRFSNEVNFGSNDNEQDNTRTGGFSSMWKVAASIAVVVGVALAAFFIMGSGDTVWTSQDTKLAVTLPDGSTVHLNHHSEIIVPANFNEDERNIILTGEAFFDVTPDKQRPFIIECQDSKTTVLGTSFNIRELDKAVQIDVVTGKVNFAKGANSIDLIKGERAFTDEDGVAKSTYNLVDASLYKKRKMQFDDQKLSEVFPLMEQYFGVIIETKNDNIRNCDFHGVFTAPELIEMCDVIEEATGNNYKIVGQKVVFSGDGCSD